MRARLKTFSLVSLLNLALFPAAQAVCMHPETYISGYREPLKAEMRAAEAIVVGRFLTEQRLQEDPDDPDGVTASIVRIGVLEVLKGKPPGVVAVRIENTSARYPMSVGETHVLLLARTNGETWLNACGNSAPLPQGARLLKRIRAELRQMK